MSLTSTSSRQALLLVSTVICSSSDCLRQESYIPDQYGAGEAGGSYAASIFARRTASAAERHRAAEKLRA